MPFEVTASQKDQTLPMILTLRGDEAIVDEFTYDSDQAMGYLGIKRSRLNQISGRELRVARIRRDRYIRPVYRESDLKDYLEWTRATATHLTSSKAIEQAVESLDDRFNDVLQVFNEKLQQVSAEQQGWMKGEFEKLPTRINVMRAVDHDAPLPQSLLQSDKVLRQIIERLSLVKGSSSLLEEKVRALSDMVAVFVPEMRDLGSAQKALRFDFDRHFEALTALIRDFQALMLEPIKDQAFQAKIMSEKIDHLSIALDALKDQSFAVMVLSEKIDHLAAEFEQSQGLNRGETTSLSPLPRRPQRCRVMPKAIRRRYSAE